MHPLSPRAHAVQHAQDITTAPGCMWARAQASWVRAVTDVHTRPTCASAQHPHHSPQSPPRVTCALSRLLLHCSGARAGGGRVVGLNLCIVGLAQTQLRMCLSDHLALPSAHNRAPASEHVLLAMLPAFPDFSTAGGPVCSREWRAATRAARDLRPCADRSSQGGRSATHARWRVPVKGPPASVASSRAACPVSRRLGEETLAALTRWPTLPASAPRGSHARQAPDRCVAAPNMAAALRKVGARHVTYKSHKVTLACANSFLLSIRCASLWWSACALGTESPAQSASLDAYAAW